MKKDPLPEYHEQLFAIARTYVWWKSPEETLKDTSYFLWHVMNSADWNDAMSVLEILGPDAFREALRACAPGALNKKSWEFWHLFLDIPVTPYPKRKVG